MPCVISKERNSRVRLEPPLLVSGVVSHKTLEIFVESLAAFRFLKKFIVSAAAGMKTREANFVRRHQDFLAEVGSRQANPIKVRERLEVKQREN